MRRKEDTCTTKIWQDYQKGLDYLNRKNLFQRVEDSYTFVQGDQWRGLESGGERMPVLNFIKPTMKYGVAMVAQNGMSINYSSMDYSPNRQRTVEICELLNKHAAATWERVKLDKYSWQIIQDAYIAGDAVAYFYDDDGNIAMELIDATRIMYADEQNPNIQEQPYILVVQRRYVEDVRREAKENGIKKEDIELIIPDTESETQDADIDEVRDDLKCITITKFYKRDGEVWVTRSTRLAVYQKDTRIEGLTLYPFAVYRWQPEHGEARGLGDVWDKIPNQIEVNKSLARLCVASKEFSFPHVVYNRDKISAESVKDLRVIGAPIEVSGMDVQDISKVVGYMQAQNINPLAKEIINDLIEQTRDLAGAGDAVTGQINPEKASGAAIIAVRDAAALPLNMQVADYKQFVEDIARIWFDMWRAYNPMGVEVVDEDTQIIIPAEELEGLEVDIRIDVSPTNPYSKYAQEQGLLNLFQAQAITFEEMVEALDDDSSLPKDKLMEIIEKREMQQQTQEQHELQRYQIAMQALASENTQLKQQVQALPQQIEKATQIGMQRQSEEDMRRQQIAELQALTQGGDNNKVSEVRERVQSEDSSK